MKRFAFVVYPSMTALDLIGAYDPLTRLHSMGFWPDLTWDFCAWKDDVQDDRGMRFLPTVIAPDLGQYDLLLIPGGFGTRALQQESGFLEWLHTAARTPLKASVCTGALLLGAAGFLQGKRATTHPNAYRELSRYVAEVVEDRRVVDEGDVVTARGVTAALDLGLYLVERMAGRVVRETIQRQMDYPVNQ